MIEGLMMDNEKNICFYGKMCSISSCSWNKEGKCIVDEKEAKIIAEE